MNEIMQIFQQLIEDWLEPIGIIAGLFFSGIALRNDTRARRIENHIKISERYREIWSAQMDNPKLDRILLSGIDLTAHPVVPAEDRMVRFIFQNILLAFEARQAGQLGDIGNFEKDVAEFVCKPIPKAVWKEIARFQPAIFRKFVDSLL